MKFTRRWLTDSLKCDEALTDSLLEEKLLQLGIEVVGSVNWSERLADFCLGCITQVAPHPNADRLRVCKVCFQDKQGLEKHVSLVCGASNVRSDMIVVLALPGTRIPATGDVLQAGVIRGVESAGMLCSYAELGLDLLSDGGKTIIDVSSLMKAGQAYPLHTPVVQALGVDDTVFHVEVTPNRPDWLGVQGIARELGAAGMGTFTPQALTTPGFKKPLNVDVVVADEAKKLCPVFALAEIHGCLDDNFSPQMCTRLALTDLRMERTASKDEKRATGDGLIAVDITNWMTFDRARPLHAFDADKMEGAICVRLAKKDEVFEALNGQTYILHGDELVVADAQGIVSLAGIMGARRAAVSSATQRFYLESALFDGHAISRTARRLGLITDASLRFERGVDPSSVKTGLAGALALFEQAGGTLQGGHIVETQQSIPTITCTYDPLCVERLTGIDVTPFKQLNRLQAMGFHAQEVPGGIEARVPSWRFDFDDDKASFEASIAEEMLRFEGLDVLESLPLPAVPQQSAQTKDSDNALLSYDLWHTARTVLCVQGLDEVITWSFIDAQEAQSFLIQDTANKLQGFEDQEPVILDNPSSKQMAQMRPSLLPGLLGALKHSSAHNVHVGGGLFELGATYTKPIPEKEKTMAAFVMHPVAIKPWCGKHQDIWHMKDVFLALCAAFGVKEKHLSISQLPEDLAVVPYMHPGQGAVVRLGGAKQVVGVFGALHPLYLKKYSLKTPVWLGECDLQRLAAFVNDEIGSKKEGEAGVAPYQRVFFDLGLIMPRALSAQKVRLAVCKAIGGALVDIVLFDVFQDEKKLGKDLKQLAFRLTLQPTAAPATEAWINELIDKALGVLKPLGAYLRRDMAQEGAQDAQHKANNTRGQR